ncbi:hypothetical protein ACFL4A_02735 [bacterium]
MLKDLLIICWKSSPLKVLALLIGYDTLPDEEWLKSKKREQKLVIGLENMGHPEAAQKWRDLTKACNLQSMMSLKERVKMQMRALALSTTSKKLVKEYIRNTKND